MSKPGPIVILERCGCCVDHGIPHRCELHPVGHRWGCVRTLETGDPMCEGCRTEWRQRLSNAAAAPAP